MSLWLSAANSYASAARGMMAAETSRAQTAITRDMTRQAMAFWFPFGTPFDAAGPASGTKRRPARRRSRAKG